MNKQLYYMQVRTRIEGTSSIEVMPVRAESIEDARRELVDSGIDERNILGDVVR